MRLPFGGLFLAASTGIVAAHYLGAGAWIWVCFAAAALGLWSVTRRTAPALAMVAAAFAAVHVWQTRESSSARLSKELASSVAEAVVRGHVLEKPSSGARVRFVLRVERLEVDGRIWPTPVDLLIITRGDAPSHGDKLEIRGTISAIPPRRNPAGFDARTWLWLRGVTCQVVAAAPDGVRVIGRSAGWSLPAAAEASRGWAERALQTGIEDAPVAANLLAGMVLGITRSIPDELREDFRRTGTFHLFSVSGLHVGMISVILWQILRLLRVPRRVAACVIIPVLFFYALMVGWKPASVRAAVMASVFMASLVIARQPIPLNSLAAAAFVILAQDTRQLFHPGFQLSFLVVAAILLIYSPLDTFLKERWRPDPLLPRKVWNPLERFAFGASGVLAGSVAVSVAAWLGSLPLTILYFHLISPSALLANLWVVPLAFVIMAVAMGTLLVGAVSTWLAAVLNNANWLFLNVLATGVTWMASWPGAYFYVGSPHFGGSRLTIFDFGSGGSVAIEHGREIALIDAGSDYDRRSTLEPWLRSRGRERPDAVVITHGDAQHVGGIAALLARGAPKVVDSVVRDRSPTRRRLHALMETSNIPKTLVRAPDHVELLPKLSAEVLHPPAGLRAANADASAAVFRWHLRGVAVLFLGDAGPEAWERLDALPSAAIRSEILILGLPRSGHLPPLNLIEKIAPTVVVVGGASSIRASRLDEDWINQIRRGGFHVVRQDHSGAVEIDFSENSFRVFSVGSSAVFERLSPRSRRFNVNRDITQPVAAGQKLIFDAMGDDMSGRDRGLTVNPDVNVGNEAQSAFPDPAFLHVDDAFDSLGGSGDPGDHGVGGLFIEEFTDTPAEHANSVDSDDHAGEKSRPVISDRPPGAAQKRE
ncbi:MAG: ComEC/Rec2 family competence protein [Terrimicrobiaceae bacterium]|nr:ComEC/Rec2 family competence protein [Terrimicrobiaceae bacterium]